MAAQVFARLIGVVATVLYTFILSFVILKTLDGIIGLRVNADEEEEGLDIALHDDSGNPAPRIALLEPSVTHL